MNYHVDNNILIKEGLISDTIICCQEFLARTSILILKILRGLKKRKRMCWKNSVWLRIFDV